MKPPQPPQSGGEGRFVIQLMCPPVAAAMQCLRLAAFMNRPTLLVIQTLVIMSPYLTNSGKFLDASALFGGTVRLAQSIGCECRICSIETEPL